MMAMGKYVQYIYIYIYTGLAVYNKPYIHIIIRIDTYIYVLVCYILFTIF